MLAAESPLTSIPVPAPAPGKLAPHPTLLGHDPRVAPLPIDEP